MCQQYRQSREGYIRSRSGTSFLCTCTAGSSFDSTESACANRNSRFPTCTDGETIEKQIKAAIGSGAELTDIGVNKPFYIEADTPAIKACIDTYNEVTGENATPFTMGGGTYARHFPYAVSFGPEHSDMVLPEFGGPMHGANEAAPIDKLLEALKIYIIALLRLEEIDF